MESRGFDIERLIKLPSFRPLFEAASAGMFQIAMNLALEKRVDGEIRYLQRNFEDPPDFFEIQQVHYNEEYKTFVSGIEVFEFSKHSRLTLKEEMQKKLDKAYSFDTTLICHLTNPNHRSSFRQLRIELKGLHSTSNVHLWYLAVTNDKNRDVMIGEVFPKQFVTYIDVNEVMKTNVEFPILQTPPGRRSGLHVPEVPILITNKLEAVPSPVINSRKGGVGTIIWENTI